MGSKMLFTLPLVVVAVSLSGCLNSKGPSEAEQVILQSTALSAGADPSGPRFDVHGQVGSVHSVDDALPASRPFHVQDISEAVEIPVRDCKVEGLYEMERQMALNEAAEDPTGQTVPVKFSYSFGKKHDALAKAANKRAVLSDNNPGYTHIPVGGRKTNKHGKKHAYYRADNTEVARQYRTGERCFFSTIQVDPDSYTESGSKYDFIEISDEDIENSYDLLKSKQSHSAKKDYLHHMIHYMYYGFCKVGRCAPDQAFAGEYSNRLFDEIPSIDEREPQIIKLYMADFRSEQVEHDVFLIDEDTTRGVEIETGIDNILNVCKIHENYYDVTKNVSLAKEVNGFEFEAIHGAVQLIHNIISHDVDGNVMSTQYTPIVIDLNGDGVRTSSTRWGTYFNMAALPNKDDQGQAHRTAWLGGQYVDFNQGPQADPAVNMDVRLENQDGFLVLLNDEGQVTSSTQMFGDNMIVGGRTYENGFLALRAYAGKNCESSQVEHRYVGPWDGALYEDNLKIWIDRNRNGVSEEGEILSLREAQVAAINACHIVHQDEEDQFGNGTHLRSAALMAGPYTHLLDHPEEIAYHLEYGQGYEGEPSYFHLAIDLIFQVNEDDRCPAGLKTHEDYGASDSEEAEEDEEEVIVPPDPLPPVELDPDNF